MQHSSKLNYVHRSEINDADFIRFPKRAISGKYPRILGFSPHLNQLLNRMNRKLDLSSTGIGRKGESEFAQLLEHLKLRTRAASRIQVLDDSEPGQQSPTNVPDDSTLQSSQDERKHDKKRKSSKRRIAQQQQEDDDHSHHSHHSGKSTNSTDLHISKDNRCALEELILARNNIEGMRLITVSTTHQVTRPIVS